MVKPENRQADRGRLLSRNVVQASKGPTPLDFSMNIQITFKNIHMKPADFLKFIWMLFDWKSFKGAGPLDGAFE